jgi:exopolyphosphatase/guanosine-5'-triphosphate,3'-diphosphate pyrophosphatase
LTNKASIDIGTNTVRCLITEDENNLLSPAYVDMKIIRLGENFKKEGIITLSSIRRLTAALKTYTDKIKEYGIEPGNVVITGTSVLRDAPNAQDVKNILFKEFGLKLSVISGEEEALITLKGISSCFNNLNEFYSIDIGGGSTEYMCVKNGAPLWKYSLNMGVVHLTEEIIKSDPVSKEDLRILEREIEEKLSSLKAQILKSGYSFEPLPLIGTAGTATTLGMVDLKMCGYDRLKINGYFLKKKNTAEIYKKFIDTKISDRLKIKGVEPGREDLVLAGTAIMLRSMDFFEVQGFTVSECGLLEGLIAG